MYIFDTSSILQMFQYYPKRFPSLWRNINQLVKQGKLISVKEVGRELNKGLANEWKDENKKIFYPPSQEEGSFVTEIFKAKNGHFQTIIRKEQMLKGMPVAAPFVIASAKIKSGIVVTEEIHAKNGSRIPNICKHFNIPYLNFEGVMEKEGWEF